MDSIGFSYIFHYIEEIIKHTATISISCEILIENPAIKSIPTKFILCFLAFVTDTSEKHDLCYIAI